jgi:two-component system LytT family response regulator
MDLKPPFIFVRDGGRFTKIVFADVRYLEAQGNFVRIHLVKGSMLILIALRQLEKELPDYFYRIHRSYIVSIHFITGFATDQVWFDKRSVPVSQPYRDVLFSEVKVVLPDKRHYPGLTKIRLRSIIR